jgi:hypothetical protein
LDNWIEKLSKSGICATSMLDHIQERSECVVTASICEKRTRQLSHEVLVYHMSPLTTSSSRVLR